MSKTIKIIDLLNKIANGEEVTKKIKYRNEIYEFNKDCKQYYSEGKGSYYDDKLTYDKYDSIEERFYGDFLNDEVEIIEEQQDIDIQSIQELNEEIAYYTNTIDTTMGKVTEKSITHKWTTEEEKIVKQQNKILQAVKQLDNKIKEIRNGK